ncbi:MAG: nicotinamide riboside transporter PnuC [Ferruginibacter sp.]|nr:nicotinamide mononucleotide transporter [Ferruginibacter sp.]
MTINEIYHTFITNIQQTRWQEWISTLMQILSVWYARKNNVLVYPTGIIGVLLASYVYYFLSAPPLYADAVLNIYYFVMSVLGWYFWLQKKDTNDIFPISWCNKKELQIGIGLFFIFWISIYFLLIKITDSNTPILDSLVSSSAVTAMWWMAKRKIENWHAWIFSNLIAIPLNFYKGFVLFTLMYILFLAMAYMGYKTWKNLAKQNI